MIYLVYLTVIILGLSMFKIKSESKIGIMLVVSLCFNAVVVPIFPFIRNAKIITVFFYLLSEWKNIKPLYRNSSNSMLNKLVLLSFAAFLINCFTSPHVLDGEYPFWRLILTDVLPYTFMPMYIYWAYQDQDGLSTILKIAFPALIVLTIVGVINYITLHSPFMDLLSSVTSDGDNVFGEKYAAMDRFRVQAMFNLACDYGHVCTITALLYIYGFYRNAISRGVFAVALVCCVFGVLACGFRTCVVCLAISALCFYLIGFETSKSAKYISIMAIILLFSYTQIPYVAKVVDNALTTITDTSGQVTGGSSIEMRGVQLLAVTSQIDGHELLGRGRGYYYLDMGWADGGMASLIDRDLLGLEGKYLYVLLENGYIGLICYLVFIIGILVYAFRNRHYDRLSAAYLFSAVMAYFLYANMTGEQSSTFSSMIAIGLGMKLIDKSIKDIKMI